MYLDVVLTQQRIALPNVYYGDMGQQITTSGSNCGYSFDYLINPSSSSEKESIMLVSAVSGQSLDTIPYENLEFLDQVTLDSQPYDIYHVICNSNQ